MARDVSNFIKITVPILLLRKHADLRDELQAAALAAGGATSHEANGIWFDARGAAHEERVYVFTYNFTDEASVRVDRATRRVVDAMFLLGEQAVMKERNYTERTARILASDTGYKARIIHAPPHLNQQRALKLPDVIADDQSMRTIQMRDPTSRGSALHDSNHIN
ncbi:hypothetical protein [Stenotrophomonas phage vB_SmaS_P15]|uniref:Uncharacterized protein n=1 Tax=Stenotrophomonas phage vB_SmaS_P15 TaxID=2894592 RepID=A0AAE8YK39_9CAUD|nr:hypothetical protein [Stenotrophomonas phage vB_SmaS_P15]